MSLSSIFNSFGRLSFISRFFFFFYNWREPVKTGQHVRALERLHCKQRARVCTHSMAIIASANLNKKKKKKIKSWTKNQKENKTKRKGAKTKGNEKINRHRRRIRKASERAFSEWCTVGDPFRLSAVALRACDTVTPFQMNCRAKFSFESCLNLCCWWRERGSRNKKKKKDEGGMSVGKTLEKNFQKKRRRRKTCPVSNATMKGPSRLCERREKDFWQKGQKIKDRTYNI